jgi:sugar phosphate isomerase/epimerase
MKVSIASYAFHGLLAEGKMDVFGYLETTKYRYRVDVADIWNRMLVSTEQDYLAKVRQAMDEKEMKLVNFCVDGAHLWDPDPEKRKKLYANAQAYLQAAVILEAKTVRLDMGGRDPQMSDEMFDYVVTRYREYAAFANDHGFRVGPESHWGTELYPDNMHRVRVAVDSPAWGILLHIGSWKGVDPAEGDRLAAPFTMHTHVPADIVTTCLEERMRILLDAGYKGYWGVEHHSGRNEYAEVEWQLAEVRRAVSRFWLTTG